jgi:heavy metal sensor kinase
VNPRSIRFRLAAWHAVIFSLVFAGLGGLLYATVGKYLRDSVGETQARRARQIAETLVSRLPETGENYVTRQINALYAPELGDRFIRVTRGDGKRVYLSGAPRDQGFDPLAVDPLPAHAPDGWRLVPERAGRHLLVASFTAATSAGPCLVEVGTSAEPILAISQRLLLLLVLGIPLVAAIAAAGGYVLAGNALAPVSSMASTAERISQHNLSERLPAMETGDELQRLGESLNRMITRLDDAFSNSKRFVADASHELRTPLAVIQGELEALVADEAVSADIKDRAGSMLEEVERLSRIVQKLFALSRLDAGEAASEWVRVDLSVLAYVTAQQMRLLADDKNISIAFDTSEPVVVMGDRARLKQVVVNLVDNAIKYTPPGGTIRLRVHGSAQPGQAVLEVEDTGIGIPLESIPLVFERFYRVDRGRSSVDQGAGLGLSIVRSVVIAHGGKIDVESAVGRGSRFRAVFPLAPAT